MKLKKTCTVKLHQAFSSLILAVAVLAMHAFVPQNARGELVVGDPQINPAPSCCGRSDSPQPGVSLFVYLGDQVGQEFTAEFPVSEQPAAVVLTAADLTSYVYNAQAGTLTLGFKFTGYMNNIDLPGPPNGMGIAFITAESQGGTAWMRGSWMATNVSPLSWTLIPPSAPNLSFGYQISGPTDQTGFFRMFIPQGLLDAVSALSGKTVTVADLALFNGTSQASVAVSEVKEGDVTTGGLIDIRLMFSEGVTEVDDEDSDASAAPLTVQGSVSNVGTTVTKRLTARAKLPISLAASQTPVRKGTSVRLYGWVKSYTPGDKVAITTNAGGVGSPGGSQKAWKRATIGADGGFAATYKARNTQVFRASYKKRGQRKISSSKLKVTVRKR